MGGNAVELIVAEAKEVDSYAAQNQRWNTLENLAWLHARLDVALQNESAYGAQCYFSSRFRLI